MASTRPIAAPILAFLTLLVGPSYSFSQDEKAAPVPPVGGLSVFPIDAPVVVSFRPAKVLNVPAVKAIYEDFAKQLVKDLNSDQVRKVATGLSTMSNEKMKEEKAAEKGGKKTKAAKTKASLVATRDVSYKADTQAYDDDFGE